METERLGLVVQRSVARRYQRISNRLNWHCAALGMFRLGIGLFRGKVARAQLRGSPVGSGVFLLIIIPMVELQRT
jgi:hypothetical protein